MAFTVTVIDRHDLEIKASRACDNCDTPTCACDGCVAIGVAKDRDDDATTVQLSPLED